MTEKELEQILYSNVDFAKLDKEHVYVFRFRKEYVENASCEDIEKIAINLKNTFDKLGIHYVILVGDMIQVTELVK